MKSARSTPTWRFTRHFLEMLGAMVLGMLLLGPLWPTIDRVELQALVMATDMTIGMAALMAVRRHSWPGVVEMSAAMFAPFVILFVPYWTGLITAGGLFLLGHLLMLPAMLLAMVHRRAEYTAAHTTHPSGRGPGGLHVPRKQFGERRRTGSVTRRFRRRENTCSRPTLL